MFRCSSRSRALRRIAAAVVICAFALVPTLSRIHDRLSTSDTFPGFKASKNLERPHERQAPVSLARAATAVTVDATTAGIVAPVSVLHADSVVRAANVVRAPPHV